MPAYGHISDHDLERLILGMVKDEAERASNGDPLAQFNLGLKHCADH
jgi:hypothetical protein